MPLPTASAPRERLHTRQIRIEGYRRDDGLWDIEGHLTDIKDFEVALASGPRPAGEPVHEMWLRLTVDATLTIHAACAATDAMPYQGSCDTITPKYGQLVGLRIAPGFTKKVRELFGGVHGCTHITELIGTVATGAYQTLVGQVPAPVDRKPFQLDGCHALDTTGPVVARFYPRWYRGEN